MYKKVKETSEYLNKSFNNESIHSAIILGSGMGGFEDKFEKIYSLDYSEFILILAGFLSILVAASTSAILSILSIWLSKSRGARTLLSREDKIPTNSTRKHNICTFFFICPNNLAIFG